MLMRRWCGWDARLDELEAKIARWARADAQAQRLMSIPGIGPVTATALLAAVGDVKTFRNGRELAAWLGLVPRQHSTGGREQLLGISKRGDSYVRGLLIHGARAVLRVSGRKTDPRSRWVQALAARRHPERSDGGAGQSHGAHGLCVVGQRGGLPSRPCDTAGLSGDGWQGMTDHVNTTTDNGE